MSNGFLSKRVRRKDQSGITSDRYEFLGLDQAEPDLGDPIVGPSSIGINPYTGSASDLYVLVSDSSGAGNRYWTQQANIISGGIVSPGSITVRDEGSIIGSVNQITDINFVGSGVTVTNPASWVGAGSSSVDIEIAVTDVSMPSGQTGSIGYRDGSGLLQGANDFVYNPSNQRVGVGTALPTEKLEVAGNIKVTGDITAQDISASSFTVSNFIINDETLTFSVTSEAVGIGTSIPIATLDVRGTTNISGVTTITRVDTPQLRATNVNVTGVTTTGSLNIGSNEVISGARQLKNIASLDAVTTATIEAAIVAAPNTFNDLNVTGISTLQTLNVEAQSTLSDVNVTGITTVGFVTATDVNVSGVATIGHIVATSLEVGFSTALNTWVSGTSTITTVDTDTLYAERIEATAIGIGTTNPQADLDVVGDIRLSGVIYDVNGTPGTAGQVLISNGANPLTWGNPSEVSAGSATSVGTLEVSNDQFYYPVFVSQTSGVQTINLDSSGLAYNPSTGNLGIGSTQPSVTLDVVGNANITGIATVGDINIQGLSRINSGIVTTSNKNTVVIDTLDTNTFRSARYSVQVTGFGKLVPGQQSVSNLSGGVNYFPGTYTEVNLIPMSGFGTDAQATITIIPEATLGITSSVDGVFFTNDDVSGISSGKTLSFNKTVFVSDKDESKVTSLSITNAGVGYTVFPTLTIDSPIIEGNPIENVGVGSTAIIQLNSLKVTNAVLTSAGSISTVPTISFPSPVGAGASAEGTVGFGISEVSIVSSGSSYTSLPSVDITGSASASISGLNVTDVIVDNVGSGYTVADFPVNISFTPSSGVTAIASQTSFSIDNSFEIASPGAGYTSPPLLTLDSPSIGVNTATATCTLGITTISVGAAGSGYVTTPSLSLSSTPTNFSASVGLGISDYLIQFSGGSGYTSIPSISFNPVNGIGTAAAAFVSRDPGTNTLFGFTITNPGYGYTTPPLVVISGGGGTGAGVTIRTMSVSNIDVIEDGYGLNSVPTVSIDDTSTQLSNLISIKSGTIGVAATTTVNPIVISSQGTLSTGTTSFISGITTFNTLQYTKTGDLDQPTDFSITGINTSNIRVGQGITGTHVSAGTTVIGVLSSQVLISIGTTNIVPVISNTFYFTDTVFESVQVGQGVTGNFISAGSTVVSVGSSSVELSIPTINAGVHTSTYYFGTLAAVPGIGATTIITGINTGSITVGQGVTGTYIQSSTTVSSIQQDRLIINRSTTNSGITTEQFYFSDLFNVTGTGANVTPTLGIGSISIAGIGTGYLTLPGIAITAVDGVTGGGGIATTKSFSISSGCISVTQPGTQYSNIPSVSFDSPIGGGTSTIASVGVGITQISVTSSGSGYTLNLPSVVFTGGSFDVGAAATISKVFPTNINITNAGSGYTSTDLPLVPTFNGVGIAASVGFGLNSVSVTSIGLGYTVTPQITITPGPSLGSTVSAAVTAILGYNSSFDLQAGYGYGGSGVYYIQPIDSSTFRVSTSKNGSGLITLGFSTSNSPSAVIGGTVNSVSITKPGSGFEVGDVVEFSDAAFDAGFDDNVGIGFSFIVDSNFNSYQVSDLLMLQTVGAANTNAYIIEYGTITDTDYLGEFSSDISGTDARLKFTPIDANTVVKLTKTSIVN